ncbi:MAG TPA: alpha/beta hydrolase-fold protein [Ferruginibacter sp.]|nr:alpha/beta hydrolase-fold protein [Ferruginibacter sp.]
MKKIILFVLILISIRTIAQTTDFSLYQKQVYIVGTDTLPYRILLPVQYDRSKKYPLIIFLHGSGERGNNNEAQLSHGGSLFIEDSVRINYPAIVVFPQCPANNFWSNVIIDTANDSRRFTFRADGEPTSAMRSLMGLLSQLQNQYKIDKHSIYIGGLSMGGMGTFELVRREPKIFAAAFSICGGADTSTAPKIKHTAWWIFHGLKDNVVDPHFSMNMAEALKKSGAEVILNLYTNDNHNSWDDALAEKDLLPWLFSHHRK